MHSHLVDSLLEGSNPTEQVQFRNWISRCLVERIELPHGPSAKRFMDSESYGENTLKVTFVQFLFTL